MLKRAALAVLALAVLGGSVFLILRARPPTQDADAVPVTSGSRSPGFLLEELQREADASALRFRINSRPVLRGDGTADLLIENSLENRGKLRVVLALANGREIYASPELPPGGQVLRTPLDPGLEPGEYPVTATVTALNPEDGSPSGQAQVELVLTVEGGET